MKSPLDSLYCRPLESQVEAAPIYRTASKATLVDQESGNVYQLIEKQRGKSSETFLLQQPLSSPAPRPPVTWHTAHCSLHTVHYTLHTAHILFIYQARV